MLRYFISPHPTFGSYKNPTPFKVEASPYYWWWYALTLNEGYWRFCDRKAEGKRTRATAELRQVYSDFGDVRYEGNRYVAFAEWWRDRVNTDETRGEYLFAEPLATSFVQQVMDNEQAADALEREDVLLVSIPLTRQRQHIDKTLNNLIRRNLVVNKGRTARDPKKSNARYSLTKAVVPEAVKKAFAVYDVRKEMEANGEAINNAVISKCAGIKYTEKAKDDEVAYSEAERNRVISATISRHVRQAKQMIEAAGMGKFPY